MKKGKVLIIGTGPGGAVTALELANAGMDVTLLEEGNYNTLNEDAPLPEVIDKLYRKKGMTPINGKVPIAYVEGSTVGGSSEINSGFWHRTPQETLLGWQGRFGLLNASLDELTPHFEWAENHLHVSYFPQSLPKSSQIFEKGIQKMGWSAQEIARCAKYDDITHFPKGIKQSVGKTIIPLGLHAGAKLITNCRARVLLKHKKKITGVVAQIKKQDGFELVYIEADHIFVACGPIETPALLRKSGIKFHVGDTLHIHPMLKIVARFSENMNSEKCLLPLIQVKEFWPEMTLGGSYFTKGLLAMQLGDHSLPINDLLKDQDKMAIYYLAVRGTGKGYVRPSRIKTATSIIRYDLSEEDIRNLSHGFAHLATLLLEAGAQEIYPSIFHLPKLTKKIEAIRFLEEMLPLPHLYLSTVHAFSTCPIGEREDRCAANSFGKIHSYDNLYINDASMLPSSPGVNPQATVMAIARRNALHFMENSL